MNLKFYTRVQSGRNNLVCAMAIHGDGQRTTVTQRHSSKVSVELAQRFSDGVCEATSTLRFGNSGGSDED